MKKQVAIRKEVNLVLTGIMLCLIALIIIFSFCTSVFSFLANWIVSGIGFIGFWVLVPFLFVYGVYLIFKKQFKKIRFDITLGGLIIIIVFLMVITSNFGVKGFTYNEVAIDNKNNFLEFNNAWDIYGNFYQSLPSEEVIFSLKTGGGYFGFAIAGLLNSIATPLGTTIICIVMMAGGLFMVFNRLVKEIFKHRERKPRAPKAPRIKKEKFKDEEMVGQPVEERPYTPERVISEENLASKPIVKPFVEKKDAYFEREIVDMTTKVSPQTKEQIDELSIKNYNNTHTLKKATFSTSEQTMQQVNATVPTSPTFKPESAVKKSVIFDEQKPISSESVEEKDEISPTLNVETPAIKPSPVASAPAPTPVVAPTLFKPVQNAIHVNDNFEEVEEDFNKPISQPAEKPVSDVYRPQPPYVESKPYVYPPTDLLKYHESNDDLDLNRSNCEERVQIINNTFSDLKVGAHVTGYTVGPSVTRYDIETNPDVSNNVLNRYINDLASRLGGLPTRFEQLVIGNRASGLEVPNQVRINVGLRESIEKLSNEPEHKKDVIFGKNISGELVAADITKFPHMLVSGTTGSGKSIFIHSTIMTLIMRNSPEELRLLLIDPKKVEMAFYKNIPHLLCPNISDPEKAFDAFQKLVDEMERRYNVFEKYCCTSISSFNRIAKSKNLQPMPTIVVFVDEYADLIEANKHFRDPVVRIAQKARAAGIHLVISTQRPSVNVIDGVVKANISTHVALMTSNAVDSQTIIGEGGAESLLGNGDMIVECNIISRSEKPRVQGCFVIDDEITDVCDFIREHNETKYDEMFMRLGEPKESSSNSNDSAPQVDNATLKAMNDEKLYNYILETISTRETCSISYIQRSFAIGFPKAGRMFNRLINEGYVAPQGDSRGNKVLIKKDSQQQIGSIEQSDFIPDDN